MKKIIYVDMDGVISNFDKAAKEGGWTHRPDLKVNFRNLDLVYGAQDALIQLNKDFDIFIATTHLGPDQMCGVKKENGQENISLGLKGKWY